MSRSSLTLPILMLLALLLQFMPGLEARAYQIDKTRRTIVVGPAGDYTKDIRSAIAYLVNRPDKDQKWTLRMNPGRYNLTLPMYSVGLRNVDIISNKDNPAVIAKASNFSGSEYLFYARMCSDVRLYGLTFYGKTTFASNKNPVWSDQGVFLGSCNRVIVDWSKFYNFGNAALRVTTSEMDPVKGVNSFNTRVTNNIFNNIYQISTTSNSNQHGATANYTFQYNTIANLRASVKFASRTPGAKNVKVLNNIFNGADIYALEIDNYSDFEIRGNTIQNVKNVAVNIYTNTRAPKGFHWGDNFNISSNTLKNVVRGIRFSPDKFSDGYTFIPRNLIISGNTLTGVTTTTKYLPAISVANGKVNGVKITSNKLNSISNKNYIGVSSGSTNVTRLDNQAEGAAYGPQSTASSQSTPNGS